MLKIGINILYRLKSKKVRDNIICQNSLKYIYNI